MFQVPACLTNTDGVLLLLVVVEGRPLASMVHISSSSSSSTQNVLLLPTADGDLTIEVTLITVDDAGERRDEARATRHTSHVTPTAACFAPDTGEGAASSWDVACVREFGLHSATVRYRFGAD